MQYNYESELQAYKAALLSAEWQSNVVERAMFGVDTSVRPVAYNEDGKTFIFLGRSIVEIPGYSTEEAILHASKIDGSYFYWAEMDKLMPFLRNVCDEENLKLLEVTISRL